MPLDNEHFVKYCENNNLVQYFINKKIPNHQMLKLPAYLAYLSNNDHQKPFVVDSINVLTSYCLPNDIVGIVYLYLRYQSVLTQIYIYS